MRVTGYPLWLLAVTCVSGLAFAEPGAAPELSPPSAPPALPTPATTEETPEPQPVEAPPAQEATSVAPLADRRPAVTLATSADRAPVDAVSERRFSRNYAARPFTLEARLGINERLGSSFDPAAHEEMLGSSIALGGYLAWNPEYALGLEVEHHSLGRVRGLAEQNSIDAEYSSTGAYLGARVFPIRRERLDVFLNLRLGLVVQHVDALGIRRSTASIAIPASPFSCSETDGPGIGLGGALGLSYRLSRHVSVSPRIDVTGERLSGEPLATCADGMGSVASVSGTLGLAYEFEIVPQ